MHHFLWFVLRIVFAISGICSLVIGSARSRPIPAVVDHLTNCRRQPCFLSIVAGHTSWTDGQAALGNWANAEITGNSIQIEFSNHMAVTFDITDDKKRVGRISLSFDQSPRPTFASLLLNYGPPCMISINADIGFVALRYDNLTAYILLKDLERDPTALHLSADSSINGLDLQPELHPCRIEDRLWETYWHGFTPFRYYAPLRQ